MANILSSSQWINNALTHYGLMTSYEVLVNIGSGKDLVLDSTWLTALATHGHIITNQSANTKCNKHEIITSKCHFDV